MTMLSVRRRATRAAALVAAGLLALGLAQAPAASAAAADAPPPPEWLSVAQLRELAATFDRGAVASQAGRGASPRRVDVVTDRRGDAERPQGLARGPRPYTRLADVTRARYKTPSQDAGNLRITTRWVDLVDGRSDGVRRQHQVTFLFAARTDRFWVVELSNADNRVRVVQVDENSDAGVRPEAVTVSRTLGAGGTTDLVVSSEWLDARRVRFGTYTVAGQFEAFDSLRLSKALTVGDAR